MVHIEALSQWLDERLRCTLVLEVWIFGSIARGLGSSNDVDVFIKYVDGYAALMPNLRIGTEDYFMDRFGIPLHLLFLSESESTEAADFLRSALRDAVRVR